jgi:hypothetical protein
LIAYQICAEDIFFKRINSRTPIKGVSVIFFIVVDNEAEIFDGERAEYARVCNAIDDRTAGHVHVADRRATWPIFTIYTRARAHTHNTRTLTCPYPFSCEQRHRLAVQATCLSPVHGADTRGPNFEA